MAQTNTARARVMQPVDMQNLVTLHGNVHPLARPEFDQGVAPDDLPMERMLLVLQRAPDQEAALRQLLDDQQTKTSPQFHRWLTPEQFGQHFGPADSDIQEVTNWLTVQGFQVTKISAGRTVIEFSGTAGLARQTLGTEIHKYALNGKDYWANASDPQIPAALAPMVAGFASLHNFPRKPMIRNLGAFSRSNTTAEVRPLFTFTTSNGTYMALGPMDFATIYNVLPLWNNNVTGAGVTIAVVGETNINPLDVAEFRSMFGLPASAPNIILNGPDPGINGDEIEADLDVQWAGAVAKGATIDLVVSETTEMSQGVDLSALYIVDNNLAPILSESYGTCEAELGVGGNSFQSTLWEQAAAQGITALMASGDSGSAGCDEANLGEVYARNGLAVSGTASTPFNVAVGGTDFNDLSNPSTYFSQTNTSPSESSAISYIPESTWNDSCAASGVLTACNPLPSESYYAEGLYLVAGSGGPSNCTNPSGVFPNVTCSGGYAKPSWQSGPGVPADGARDIPDVSLFAGNGLNKSFYVICQMYANSESGGSGTSCNLNSPYTNFEGVGGTSASAQVFAGVMALVNQKYGRQGNVNYVLYPMAAANGASCNSSSAPVTNSSCIFYDITAGNNSVICAAGSPDCSLSGDAFGIMVSGGTAAYPTTAGYDLATGLGSVNVANLVNKWASNFTPSTTTLALSTNPATNPLTLTHGQPVNFTIDVTPGSGSSTPTGDVSLIAPAGSGSSNTTGIGPFTLSGGSVSGTTNMLPAGSYTVTAHYAGDGTSAASDSAPGIPVTVTKESSLTEMRLVTPNTLAPVYSTTSAPYGSYALRIDVTNSSGQFCADPATGLLTYACPTGALTVSPAPTHQTPPPGGVPGSYTLNSQGLAEDQTILQGPGVYNFVAAYAGDNNYASSVSPAFSITITPATTTTTLTTAPTSTVAGTTVTLGVNLSTGYTSGVAPTGTIEFLNNGTSLGKVALANVSTWYLESRTQNPRTFYQGTGTLAISLPGGMDSITATYSGDGNYAASNSAASIVTVTDFSLSANPAPVNISAPGGSGSSTLTVAPQNGFSGSVTLSVFSGCPPAATCTVVSPVTISGTSAQTAVFTVATTAAAMTQPQGRIDFPPGLRFPTGFLLLLAAFTALAALLRISWLRWRPAAWSLMLALLVMGLWVGCGGGSKTQVQGTPAGTYPVVIDAVDGADGHSITVIVVVQ
jgi:hypothetical protein